MGCQLKDEPHQGGTTTIPLSEARAEAASWKLGPRRPVWEAGAPEVMPPDAKRKERDTQPSLSSLGFPLV